MSIPEVPAAGHSHLSHSPGLVAEDRHRSSCARLEFPILLPGKHILHGFHEMVLSAEEHAADEIGGGYPGGPFDHAEATGGLDEPITIVPLTVRRDIVPVDHVFAAVMGDPGQVGHIGCMGNTLSGPSTRIHGGATRFKRRKMSVQSESARADSKTNRSSRDITVGPLFSRIA